jgi:GTP cyclohydrolase I
LVSVTGRTPVGGHRMTVELTTAHRDRPEQPVDLVAAELAAARLTRQVADHLAAELHPRGVGVVLQAEHACMTLRGVRAAGATTVTSALPGTLRTDPGPRAEFFALAGLSS